LSQHKVVLVSDQQGLLIAVKQLHPDALVLLNELLQFVVQLKAVVRKIVKT
jgi:hypothetical protein